MYLQKVIYIYIYIFCARVRYANQWRKSFDLSTKHLLRGLSMSSSTPSWNLVLAPHLEHSAVEPLLGAAPHPRTRI